MATQTNPDYQNSSIRWCFSCMQFVSVQGDLCLLCGEAVTFNKFTPKQVMKYRELHDEGGKKP